MSREFDGACTIWTYLKVKQLYQSYNERLDSSIQINSHLLLIFLKYVQMEIGIIVQPYGKLNKGLLYYRGTRILTVLVFIPGSMMA